MLLSIIVLVLVINLGLSLEWQKGTWVSNANNSNLLQNHLKANAGLATFKYNIYRGLFFLQFQDFQHGKNIVQMALQMHYINKTYQPQNFSDSLVDIKFSRKRISNLFSYVLQLKQDISFNVTFVYRRTIWLQCGENQYKISLVDFQRTNPQFQIILIGVCILVSVQAAIMACKIQLLIQNDKINKRLGVHSIQIMLLWTAKNMIAVWGQTYYLQDVVRALLQVFIFFLQVALFYQYSIYSRNLKNQNKNNTEKKLGTIIVVIYWIGFLLEVLEILKIRLWYILLIINIYQFKQITKVRYAQNIISKQQTIIFVLFYLIPIAIFPYFAEETNYPKEEAQLWYVYAILCISQVTLFHLSLNGGAAVFKRLQLCFKKRVNRNKYQKLQQKICPICAKEVEIIEIDMDSAGQIMESKCVKNECDHYFHKTCIKDNKNTVNKCFFDGQKFSQQLIAIRILP